MDYSRINPFLKSLLRYKTRLNIYGRMASEQILLENLQNSLRVVTELRAVSANLWQTTADGMGVKHGKEDGGRERRFLSELKLLLEGVGAKIG